MRKAILPIAYMVLAALMLASCSAAGMATLPPDETAAPQLTHQKTPINVFSSAVASDTMQAAAQPSATPASSADTPLTAYDYYIIDANYRSPADYSPDDGGDTVNELNGGYSMLGVVDARGKVVLPFQFSEITPLVSNSDSQAADAAPAPFYFFAVGYTFDGKAFSQSETGYIYNGKGEKAFQEPYEWVFDIGNGLIAGYRRGGRQTGAGVMTYSGKTVIPFKYENIVYLGKGVIAAVGGKGSGSRVDFYDYNGALKGTLALGSADDAFEQNGVLVARGRNGLYGFIDSSMKWCCPPKWTEVESDISPDGLFYVDSDGDYSDDPYVNKYGKKFIPDGYDPDWTRLCADYSESDAAGGHALYIVSGDAGSAIVNDAGKILFTSKDDIDYEGDVILTGGRAFDITGRDLLPGVTDISQWIPEDNLFICKNCVYNADGTKLPLPEAASVAFLAYDRYLITTSDGLNGLCNARGKWLVRPTKDFPDANQLFDIEDGTNNGTYWPCYKGANGKYGLLDDNGAYLTGPVYDECSQQGDLIEVWCGPVHGLIDRSGNWVWYSSVYDILQD